MKHRLDKTILKIFPETPCLSPNRYSGFLILDTFLNRFLKNNKEYKILDAGCGTGIYSQFIKKKKIRANYLGVDYEFKADTSFYRSNKSFEIRFLRKDLMKLRLKERYDLILSLWTLEHLRNDLLALKILKRHLKKRGLIFLSLPAIWTWPLEFGRHGFHYYSLKKIDNLLKKSGLKIISIKKCSGPLGLLFNLIYQWGSYLVLLPVFSFYKILGKLPKKKTKEDFGNARLSKNILNNTIFFYKKTLLGREIHYRLVKLISQIDQNLPFLESSYCLVLGNNNV